jgi:hemoglobin
MKDIENEKDIKLFLDAFYEKVKVDEVISYLFNDVAKLNWDEHMPKIYAFWESILLGKASFSGDVMGAHIRLHQKEKLTTTHFDRWIQLFEETLNEMYEGAVATEAINRARTIRRTMEFNILNSR